MKKVLAILMISVFIISLVGCSESGNNSKSEAATSAKSNHTDTQTEPETKAKSKSLVVYFSRAGEQYGVGVIEKGNTAIVADMIIDETGADGFEIVPKEDNYPASYDALTDYAKEEQNNNARPEIKDTVENFESYDTVYLGYPIWWGDLPMICYTFLESYDFSGKTVIPFCTHAGSGDAGTQGKIRPAVPNADVKEVLAITGTEAQNNQDSVKSTVKDWVSKLR